MQKILASLIDEEIQNTQYGFRKSRSTAQAIHIIRRIQEYAEKGKNRSFVVLLDWEKAFDKADQSMLMESLKWHGIPEPLRNLIKKLYAHP